jgi:predicted GNAT family N-acyltransferase
MIASGFTVEPATWLADAVDLRAVRTEVFVVEQAVPAEEEWDEHDARSHHVIARDAEGRPIGTGRLTPMRTIGRMAVVRDWRGKGVGEAILRTLIERARELHIDRIELHSQVHAIPFYERAGFVAHGDTYDECGIAHRDMLLEVAPAQAPARSSPPADAGAETWITSTRDEARAAMLGVIGTARRDLAILTRDLDPDLLGHVDVIEALKQVALGAPNTRIRILVLEPARAGTLAPRLVALAQRLSSVFAMRTPVEEIDRQHAGAFIANDRGGCYERPLASRHDGEGSSHAPARAAQLLSLFNETWERSEPAADLRRLEI